MVCTIKDTKILCGVNDVNIFEGFTPALICAVDIFTGDFSYFMDKIFEEFEYEFNTYYTITVAQ